MMTSALVLLAALCQDDGKEFYKFKPGTEWVYLQVDGESRKISKMTVKEEKDGKTIIENVESAEGSKEPGKTETIAIYSKDGILTYAQVEDGQFRDLFGVLKLGSKKGDKWKSPAIMGDVDGEVENLGTTNVTVFQGQKEEKTYKDAVRTQLKFAMEEEGMKFSFTADYYFVKNVGLVKMQVQVSSGEGMTLELKQFTAGK
jgi:hypothetical protein